VITLGAGGEHGTTRNVLSRQKRSDIPYPQVDPHADAWTRGVDMQLRMTKQ
jgi:hypothetical protein